MTKSLIGRRSDRDWIKHAILSLVFFLIGMLILVFIIWNQETLVRLGLIGRMYYIALLPLSFSAGAFLFNVLNSFASYNGRQLGGGLKLGGPIVVVLLTLILGFWLPKPDASDFPMTVFVHGEQGPFQTVLRSTGSVVLDLGANRRSEAIGDKGQAFFPGIPSTFRNQEVHVSVYADGYESVYGDKPVRLTNASIYLPVRRTAGLITGRVLDENGAPLSGASIVSVR